jgi:hypothetical protein
MLWLAALGSLLVLMQIKTDALPARRGMLASIEHTSAQLRRNPASRARTHVSMVYRWTQVICLRSAELLHVCLSRR